MTNTSDGSKPRFALAMAMLSLLVVSFAMTDWDASLRQAALASVALSIFVLAALARMSPGRVSPGFAYGAVFALFHLGLAVLWAVDKRIPSFMDAPWLHGASIPRMLLIAAMGLVAFAFGVAVVSGTPQTLEAQDELEVRPPDPIEHRFSQAGFLITLAGILMWLAQATAAGGVGVLFGRYRGFLDATAGTGVGITYFVIGLGVVIAASGASDRHRTRTFVLFALFALLALPLGLRGEVLFPAVVALTVASRRTRIPAVAAVAVVLVTLAMIGGIRQVRQVGVSQVSVVQLIGAPIDGLAELGGSIRPLVEVSRWHAAGAAPRHGDTYVAPLDRAFDRVLGIPRPSAQTDARLFNREISLRVGPIGGSPAAEAYRNFGVFGVALRMLLTGLAVGFLGRLGRRKYKAMSGVLLLPLLIEIRNNFAPVPVQMMIGALIVVLLVSWPSARGHRARLPGAISESDRS